MEPDYHAQVTWSRFRRWLAAIPSTDFVAAVTAVAAVITIGASIVGGSVKPETLVYLYWSLLGAGIAAILLGLVIYFKTALEYKRRTYEPTVIIQFQQAFDDLEQKKIRANAAKACDEFLRSGSTMEHVETERWKTLPQAAKHAVEPVLDFFSDLGFYLYGDHFSDEVVHHHLFYWIRGWYSVLKPFIQHYQSTEPAAYSTIPLLHGRTAEIEKSSGGRSLLLTSLEEKLEFLRSEL